MAKENKIQVPLPIIIMKEGKWFVASCPPLNIATQGKTDKEVKENMNDLIDEYLQDPDTSKPKITMQIVSLEIIQKILPQGVLDGKTQTPNPIKSNQNY